MSHLLSKNYLFFENLVSWVLSFQSMFCMYLQGKFEFIIYCQNRDSWLRLRINQRSVKSSQKTSVFVWLSRERIYQLHPHHHFLFIFFLKEKKINSEILLILIFGLNTAVNTWIMENGFKSILLFYFSKIYKCTTSHGSHRASTFALVLSFHKK